MLALTCLLIDYQVYVCINRLAQIFYVHLIQICVCLSRYTYVHIFIEHTPTGIMLGGTLTCVLIFEQIFLKNETLG